MKQVVVRNEQYSMRVYKSNAILFNYEDKADYRILNPIEKEILCNVDGEKELSELMRHLCSSYSIDMVDNERAEYKLLQRYFNYFFEHGILLYKFKNQES